MSAVAPDQPAVVAGNGASLAQMRPGSVLTSDFILRTNSFFFEPRYYLGRRVDMAMISGDPRVTPFVFETLWRCRDHYDLRHWSSHDARVHPVGQKRFGPQFVPMRHRDASVETAVSALCAEYAKQPTTGIMGALFAHALGAERIILAGIDLYSQSRRYVYEPGPNYRALMGADVGGRGFDQRLHDRDLDRAILAMLNARADVTLFDASSDSLLGDLMEPAPRREGPRPAQEHHDAPTDWAGRAGLYPIGLLRLMRNGRRLQRRLMTGETT